MSPVFFLKLLIHPETTTTWMRIELICIMIALGPTCICQFDHYWVMGGNVRHRTLRLLWGHGVSKD